MIAQHRKAKLSEPIFYSVQWMLRIPQLSAAIDSSNMQASRILIHICSCFFIVWLRRCVWSNTVQLHTVYTVNKSMENIPKTSKIEMFWVLWVSWKSETCQKSWHNTDKGLSGHHFWNMPVPEFLPGPALWFFEHFDPLSFVSKKLWFKFFQDFWHYK